MIYEVTIEDMTPCGGEKYAIRQILEVEAENPMQYVMEHKRFPNVNVLREDKEEMVIQASNPVGYKTRYTFTWEESLDREC